MNRWYAVGNVEVVVNSFDKVLAFLEGFFVFLYVVFNRFY